MLTNAELAKRTGLARSTVSRLTRSLVDAGFLGYDLQRNGYRLQAVTLSLALAYRSEATLLSLATPCMEKVARSEKVNVGLAVADAGEMVYLESVRGSRQGVSWRLMPGSRVPIASTSLGYAYLCDPRETRYTLLTLNGGIRPFPEERTTALPRSQPPVWRGLP
ncbi:helix-turn-helix domain-containing protein [Cupriavidus pinatubonensis]|uniref:Regulatory protein, IclR n=1 Tax=Cupriavidus pinatubonensis TaxID=248026 RepID=A0ABM8Y268_9BURK|nr:hypothetical protein LMG23994_06397 [Cupriavidus pinatubonensis]